MIKASSIKKLNEKCIASILNDNLSEKGFKYLKSKQIFKKRHKEFLQIISVTNPHNPLEYIEKQDEVRLKFDLTFSIEIPKFDIWIEDKLKERSYFRHQIKKIESFTVIDFFLLEKEDFFTPSESQVFKNNVTSSLIKQEEIKRESLTEVASIIDAFIIDFNEHCNYQTLFNKRSNSYTGDYSRLLVYGNLLEEAKASYKLTYEKYIEIINEKFESNVQEVKRYIQNFEKIISEVELFLDLKLENPFSQEIQKMSSKNTNIKLSKVLGYSEVLRFNTKLIDIKSFDINDNGELVGLIEGKKLIKIDVNGNLSELGQLNFQDHFRNDIDYFEVKWNKIAGCFTCNNYIIKNDKLIELKLEVANDKKNKISPQITDLAYDANGQQFLLIYTSNFNQSLFSKFNLKGELIETRKIEQFCVKINPLRKELITQNKDNSMNVLDFNGMVLDNYKFNNGNNRISLSPDGNEMVFHFYSTKSQYYNLKNNSKKTLWAHPTYLKKYKEKFYNDIHHNFGMTYCKFTPDGKYIIGGANHGKYVIWDTVKFERKELIPNDNSFEFFNQFSTSTSQNESTIQYFKPYTVEHENQILFINRGYSISNISFIDNGKFIITQVGDSLLVWNENFKNIGHLYGLENVVFSETNYLAFKNEKELVLYKRIKNFNNDFESSIFKEKRGVNSNVTTHINLENSTHEKTKKLMNKEIIKSSNENIKIGENENNIKGFLRKLFKR